MFFILIRHYRLSIIYLAIRRKSNIIYCNLQKNQVFQEFAQLPIKLRSEIWSATGNVCDACKANTSVPHDGYGSVWENMGGGPSPPQHWAAIQTPLSTVDYRYTPLCRHAPCCVLVTPAGFQFQHCRFCSAVAKVFRRSGVLRSGKRCRCC